MPEVEEKGYWTNRRRAKGVVGGCSGTRTELGDGAGGGGGGLFAGRR